MWKPKDNMEYFEIWKRIMSYGYSLNCLRSGQTEFTKDAKEPTNRLFFADSDLSPVIDLLKEFEKKETCADWLFTRL